MVRLPVGARFDLEVVCRGVSYYTTDNRYGRGEGATVLCRYVFYDTARGVRQRYVYTGVRGLCNTGETFAMRATVKRIEDGVIRLSRPKRLPLGSVVQGKLL